MVVLSEAMNVCLGRSNGGLSGVLLPRLGLSRHANDNSMHRANLGHYSNRFRGDDDDNDGGFRGEVTTLGTNSQLFS